MNKTILEFSIVLIVVAMLATPVIAEPPITIPVKAEQTGAFQPAEKTWSTKGGVDQARSIVNTGTVNLYIPATSSEPAYVFSLNSVFDRTRIEKVPLVRMHVDAEWIYKEDGEILGTFRGELIYHGSSMPTAEVHGVLQGTGIFKGQTLKLERAVGVSPLTWVGTLIER